MYKRQISTVIMLLIFWLVGCEVALAAPSAAVTYTNEQANLVDITIHFNDLDGTFTKVQYATAMNVAVGELNWGNDLVINGTNPNRYVVISGATKYMNYFVRIAKPDLSEATNVRVFPVNTVAAGGITRDQNDYSHGNYQANTDMCGACHSTHFGLKADLLNRASYYELCMVCHSTANTQSKYDVESGMESIAGNSVVPSPAGPLVSQSGTPAVSRHEANDTTGVTPVNVPGSDIGGTKKLGLTCVSCHDVHGGNNDNYRLLKQTIYADDGKSLVSNNLNYTAYAITASATSGEAVYMVKGNTEFCSACHLDYAQGNAKVPGGVYAPNLSSGLGISRYRHPVSVASAVYSVYGNDGSKNLAFTPASGDSLPLQYNPNEQKVGITDKRTAIVCSTCHYAHGSTKSFNTVGTQNDGRYMLRLDNYGVCESCHKQ